MVCCIRVVINESLKIVFRLDLAQTRTEITLFLFSKNLGASTIFAKHYTYL
jgi:hypothetical protein